MSEEPVKKKKLKDMTREELRDYQRGRYRARRAEILESIQKMDHPPGLDPDPDPSPIPKDVTFTIKADATQVHEALERLREDAKETTEELARVLNIRIEGDVNPLEALFYIADVQKEILAELKAIRRALPNGGT